LKEFHNNYKGWILLSTSYVGEFYANDIVNEAFIKLNEKQNINRSYIFLTIRSLCIDFLREKNKIDKTEILDVEFVNEFDKLAAYNRILYNIDKEIDTWYWYDAQLFRLYKDSPMSLRKIANETDISITSIFHTIKKCKQIIKIKFIEDYQDYLNGDYELIN